MKGSRNIFRCKRSKISDALAITNSIKEVTYNNPVNNERRNEAMRDAETAQQANEAERRKKEFLRKKLLGNKLAFRRRGQRLMKERIAAAKMRRNKQPKLYVTTKSIGNER